MKLRQLTSYPQLRHKRTWFFTDICWFGVGTTLVVALCFSPNLGDHKSHPYKNRRIPANPCYL